MEKNKVYRIQGSLEKVREILANLKSFGRIHPLITKVEQINGADKKVKEYKIWERPYTWLSIKITYKAKVKAGADEIEYAIYDIPFTKAWIHYKLTQKLGIVEIEFHLRIDSKLIGKRILLYKMMKAQDDLMGLMQSEMNALS